MSFDTSKFEFAGISKGEYEPSSNQYVYVSYGDVKDLSSVTFTFKTKATGTGKFSISNPVFSSGSATIGNSSTTVNVVAKSNTVTKPKTTTTKTEPEQTVQEPEVLAKPELERLKLELEGKIQSDYTEDSWKALQEVIAKAEAAATDVEYNEVKDSLTIETLVIADFEKEELFDLLIELIGKSQKDYTEDSWNELQSAIDDAQSAKLKSEYDSIKGKLNTKGLVEKKGIKDFFENFIKELKAGEPVYIICTVATGLVLLLIIIIFIMALRNKKRDIREIQGARRLK